MCAALVSLKMDCGGKKRNRVIELKEGEKTVKMDAAVDFPLWVLTGHVN